MGEARRRREAAGQEGKKMPTRQQIIDELRQRFASADEAALGMIEMFEQALSSGQVVPRAVLDNALAMLTSAFGDTTDDERKSGERLRSGDVVHAQEPPSKPDLVWFTSTPLGTVRLKRDIALRLHALRGAAQDVPYQFAAKVDLGNQN
jgi:hypothetical protein